MSNADLYASGFRLKAAQQDIAVNRVDPRQRIDGLHEKRLQVLVVAQGGVGVQRAGAGHLVDAEHVRVLGQGLGDLLQLIRMDVDFEKDGQV